MGDSFVDVMNKFPQERDYLTDEEDCFYGVFDYLGSSFGRVSEHDFGDPTVVLVAEDFSIFKIHFEYGVVSWMQIFFTIVD